MTCAGIDLWWFVFPDGVGAEGRALALLDDAERVRFRQIQDPNAARLFALRRAARRVILADYCGEAPESLTFAEAPAGKPHLVGPATDIGFSASDCASAGVLAVAPTLTIGADLELPRTVDTARLAERILSPGELASLHAASTEARPRIVLGAWTAKEALVKATGTGMDLAAFRRVTVLPDNFAGKWRAAVTGGDPALPGEWWIWTRELPLAGAIDAIISIAAPSALPVRVIEATASLARHGLR